MAENEIKNINADDALLKVEDLEVIYSSRMEVVQAVNHINFEVKRGQTLGIVGETGAGKTTTAYSIMRILPDRTAKVLNGKILFDGEDLLTLPENTMRNAIRGEKIAIIFQDPMSALNPIMRVGDQIAEALKYHNKEDLTPEQINEKVDQTLELVGIQRQRKFDYPHQLSGGMKQRVVIAIALVCEPELIIADEPTTALDVTIQAQVLAMIDELRENLGTALILITHDLGIVAQMCDNVAIMYAGEIIENGTVEDIYSGKMQHPYTTGLFGSLPDLEKKTARLSPIDGLMPDPTNLPKGCKFNPRCPKCMDICKEQAPPEVIDGTHRVTCHLYADMARELSDAAQQVKEDA
ncbi:MAG: ABC transporter ATP-binding protein [Firmicutes bacterium]|nr:ABC transporter ATP-binding protein [Bacillota bacterium]